MNTMSPIVPRSKAVAIVESWKKLLSDEDNQFLEEMRAQQTHRPLPTPSSSQNHVNNGEDKETNSSNPVSHQINNPVSQQDAIFSSLNASRNQESLYEELYREEWLSGGSQDEQVALMTEEVNKLNSYKQACETMIANVQCVVSVCEQIKEQYQQIAHRATHMHQDCEKLLQEKERLSQIVDGVESRLKYFEDMEQLTAELNSNSVNVQSLELFSNLKKLDDSIRFLSANPLYRESKAYLTKYRQLLNRALGYLRDTVNKTLCETTESIRQVANTTMLANSSSSSMHQNEPMTSLVAKEIALYYIQYRAQCGTLKNLTHEIETRASSQQEYSVYLYDVLHCYYEQRRTLMFPIIDRNIGEMLKQKNIVDLVRNGCSYMILICSEEDQLFRHFFSSDIAAQGYRSLIELFFSTFYEGLRASVIHQNDLDVLCDLVEILRTEILLQGIKAKGLTVNALEPIVHRMIQDVQERLIFKAASFIGDRLRSFKPKSEELNYPDILPSLSQTMEENLGKITYVNWYPTLNVSLILLNKLYRALDIGVFESLAQEAISYCVSSLIDASKRISEKKTVTDGELFLIKHLLAFCEQISGFQANFKTTQVILDFSHLREGISRFFRGQSSFKVQSIISEIMTQPKPRIMHLDSKKDLENQLKTVCESFILNVTRSTLDPLTSFLKKLASHKKNKGTLEGFATITETKDIFSTMDKSLHEVLPMVKQKLESYLSNKNTRVDLMQAVKANLVEIYKEFWNFVEFGFSADQSSELKKHVADPAMFSNTIEEQLKL